MNIEDVIKLVDAGFKAEHIAQMYAAEKIQMPAQNQSGVALPATQEEAPASQPLTFQQPDPAGATPDPVPDPKPEEVQNKEVEDLKKQLEESQKAVRNLQGVISSMDVVGAKDESVDDYLHRIFKEICS